ncbi:mariner Mos1 transposase [Trichonephila clavipes]|nr:mariner Mos1 transposase [Trichonephila clavipes]
MLAIHKFEAKQRVAPGDTSKPRVKPNLQPKKTMICVWWDWEGMVYWEMLERNDTVNKELYIDQLHHVKSYWTKKTPSTRPNHLLHDNSTLHAAQVVKAALQKLKRLFLPHRPYSSDLFTMDYHLFHSLSEHMRSFTIDNEGVVVSNPFGAGKPT